MDIEHPPQPKGQRNGPGAGGDTARAAYWVSLKARDDAEPFASGRAGTPVLNARGKALAAAWAELGELREGIEPDALAIGPRSLEGILLLPAQDGSETLLGPVLRFFKVISALRLAQAGKTAALRSAAVTGGKAAPKAPAPLWKKGYTEKALADAASLAKARKALKRAKTR